MSRNPQTMTNPVRQDSLTTLTSVIEPRPRAILQRSLLSWQFTGVLRSQAEYDQLKAWCAKTGVITITDHLGVVRQVAVQRFEPKQGEHPVASVKFFPSYTVTAYILS